MHNPAPLLSRQDSAQGKAQAFAGFALPTSNTTYVPNQFFDVCLPHSSRGVVRLVGYLIRKTLGWCDEEGRPREEVHAVSYSDLIERAGVSRDMIRSAVDEAVQAHFIRCVRSPQAKGAGRPAVTGLYELQWDERGEYQKDPRLFRGFFAGEGHRTYVPNAFFDELLPNESLAVLKVVGSVTRFSIGFQTKWGHRRQNVALSLQHVQNYSKLRDRKTLVAAVRHALECNYIERVEEGYFDPRGGRHSKAAVYALKWLQSATEQAIGRKSPPAENGAENRSEIPTGNGRKTPPGDRSEIPTGIEIKQSNKTSKQQPAAALFQRLKAEGFDARAAQAIASGFPAERIERQLRWIDRRSVRSNRLGLLRSAIEQDWPEPGRGRGQVTRGRQLGEPNFARPSGGDFTGALDQARQRLLRRGPRRS
jgi:hypothetical protein